MSIVYRDAVPADGPALAATGRRVFAETFGAAFDPADMALHLDRKFGPEGLPAELGDPAIRIRLAEAEGGIIAYVKLAPMTLPVDHPAGTLEIKQLYVLAPWQGAGVAAALMLWVIDTARSGRAPALFLSVWEHGDRAIAFYRRHGFVTVGEAPFPLGTRTWIDPVMRLDLL
ncbi:MAG TPA: GNAT family N-acetyltransferase [Allosphingosinicella sp.]|nr:GNAT family N-acetyltransferase [Allosphingosinicella sp.]